MSDRIEPSSRRDTRKMLLGRFEESILLAAMACGSSVTAEAIGNRIEHRLGKRTMQTILTTLDRLTAKGFLEKGSEETARKEVGGRRRCIYTVTKDGQFNASYSYDITRQFAAEAGIDSPGKNEKAA